VGEKTIAEWKGGMEFDIELHGHHFTIDADEKVGGNNKGPRPKSLLLSALAGDNLDTGKIEKAVKMSQTKYCGVTAMLEKTAKINYEIILNT